MTDSQLQMLLNALTAMGHDGSVAFIVWCITHAVAEPIGWVSALIVIGIVVIKVVKINATNDRAARTNK